jgi:hypothetical protein
MSFSSGTISLYCKMENEVVSSSLFECVCNLPIIYIYFNDEEPFQGRYIEGVLSVTTHINMWRQF